LLWLFIVAWVALLLDFMFPIYKIDIFVLVRALKRITIDHFDMYFHIWRDGGENWELQQKKWEKEEKGWSTVIAVKTNARCLPKEFLSIKSLVKMLRFINLIPGSFLW
jgi:hypothetical protein